MSVKTETRKFERKRPSDFLFLVHNFTAADRLNPASPWGIQRHGWCSVRREQWEGTGKVHQSSGSFGACWFLHSPAEGAVTSHSCCLAPSWELGEFWLCGGPHWQGKSQKSEWCVTVKHLFWYVIKVCSTEGLRQQEVYLFLSVRSNSRAAGGPEVFAPKNGNSLVCLKMTPQSAGGNTVCQHNIWRNKIPISIKLWRDQLLSIKNHLIVCVEMSKMWIELQ